MNAGQIIIAGSGESHHHAGITASHNEHAPVPARSKASHVALRHHVPDWWLGNRSSSE
jgi:hypothetical protein